VATQARDLIAQWSAWAYRRLAARLRVTERPRSGSWSTRLVQFPGGSARPPEASPS